MFVYFFFFKSCICSQFAHFQNSGGEIEEDGDDLEEEFTTVKMTSQPKSGSAEIYSPTRRPMTTSAFIYSPSTTMPYSPRTTHRVTATTPQPNTSQMSTDMETTEFVATSASTTSLQTESESTQTQACKTLSFFCVLSREMSFV